VADDRAHEWLMIGEKDGSPRTRKSSLTLAAFRPWGSSARYRRTGNLRRVYETADRIPRLVPAPRILSRGGFA